MSKKNRLREYNIRLELASGARLEMLLFSYTEHKWIFTHKFVSPERPKGLEEPTLVNDTILVVDYDDGVSQRCNLMMNIIRPDRRRKEYFAGVDISEGSHLYIEFLYEKQAQLYRMKTVDLGIHGRVDLDSIGEGLVKHVDFPFPLRDRIEKEFGIYKVPFLKSNLEEAFFEFPENYQKR